MKLSSLVQIFSFLLILASCNGGGGGSASGGGVVDINPTAGGSGGTSGENGGESGGSGSTPSVPSAPTALARLSPLSEQGVDPTPEFTVSGVTSGDTVELFTDSSCQDTIGAAVASGSSVTISTEVLEIGNYTFYAQASNVLGASPCSSVSVSYEYVSCPEGHIPVPHKTEVGTTEDFCVMAYEAAMDNNGKPLSQQGQYPWENITALDAQLKCSELGEGYRLISNAEWMTIARSIEGAESNWINGFGTGQLVRGHSDTSPTRSCATSISNVHWSCGGVGTQPTQLRTHTLENGAIIWDFSGNDWEWVDWNASTEGFQLAPQTCTQTSSTELPSVTCPELLGSQYLPSNPSLTSANNVGKFTGGTGGAAARGGAWGTGSGAGIYALRLDFDDSTPNSGTTFRCVYKP